MKKIFLALFALALVATACTNNDPVLEVKQPYSGGIVKLAGREISADFALDTASQKLGLGGRTNLEENQGMVFFFQIPDLLEFWMKDMLIPIDIIWIKDDTVVDITANVQHEPGVADSDLKVYRPNQPANRVLEVKAGWAERSGLKIGDKVEIIRHLTP